jgi:hypothetical protein
VNSETGRSAPQSRQYLVSMEPSYENGRSH